MALIKSARSSLEWHGAPPERYSLHSPHDLSLAEMVLSASFSVSFALLLQLSAASSVPVVRRMPQDRRVSANNLRNRATFVGAAPLRAQTCPTELTDCGVSGALGTHYCCPKDTVCAADTTDCCPTGGVLLFGAPTSESSNRHRR